MEDSPPVDATDVFQDLVADIDFPMLIVTADDGNERSGCLLGFSTQCSIYPARFVICVSQTNHTHGVALRSTHLGVHFLGPSDRDIATLFGEVTGDDIDKFERCEWHEGPHGVPIVESCRGWFVGAVVRTDEGGDHTLFIVEVVEAGMGRGDGQLGFQDVKDMTPGHEA
jgi:flavin reductase (DIM6/NTAB) family NADH-FMN oxidoreductase RutF